MLHYRSDILRHFLCLAKFLCSITFQLLYLEKLLVKEDPGIYHHINQGCLTVDGMDDQEEMRCADVCTI